MTALLTQREPQREKPLVMSDALSSNKAEETHLIRCHCLAHGRRKFSELDEVFPAESAVVVRSGIDAGGVLQPTGRGRKSDVG